MKNLFITLTLVFSIFLTPSKAQTWSVDSLLSIRIPTTVATVSSKIIVIGGNFGPPNTTTVEVYDDNTKIRTESTLSFREFKTKAIPLGNKVYCFQGFNADDENSRNLDIYNATSNTWQRDSLPFIPNDVGAGAIGSKLFIAGGFGENTSSTNDANNIVRIFDTVTQKWTYTPALSVARRDIQVIRVKNKLLFVGGFSVNPFSVHSWTFYKNIDIYDETTGRWSTVFMKTGRANPTLTVSGSKVLIIGGSEKLDFYAAAPTLYFTKSVEIYDVDTDTWQVADLPKARLPRGVATYDKKAYIICGSVQDDNTPNRFLYKKIDVYDFTTNTWSEQPLPDTAFARSGLTVGLKNKIYFMGGNLENFSRTKRIDILTLPPSSISDPYVLANKLTLSPNPVSDDMTLDFEKGNIKEYAVKISNALGQTVAIEQAIKESSIKIDVKNLNQGIYFLTIQTDKGVKTQSFIKQ